LRHRGRGNLRGGAIGEGIMSKGGGTREAAKGSSGEKGFLVFRGQGEFEWPSSKTFLSYNRKGDGTKEKVGPRRGGVGGEKMVARGGGGNLKA